VILASRTIVMVRLFQRFRETSQTDARQKVSVQHLHEIKISRWQLCGNCWFDL